MGLAGLLLPVQMYVLALRGAAFGLDLGQVRLSASNFLDRRPLYAGDISQITFSFLPPSAALLTSPMGLVSFDVAAKALLGLQVASLAATTWIFVRRFCGKRWVPALVGAWIGLALADPFVYTLQFGSVNGLVLAAMLLFFVGAADDRRWAGPVLGLSLALKPILWPLLIALVLRRQYRQVVAAAAVLAGLLLVALVLAPDGTKFAPRSCRTSPRANRGWRDSTSRCWGSYSRRPGLPPRLSSGGCWWSAGLSPSA